MNEIPQRNVLIVDASLETREVLRTALAAHGTWIWEATSADEGLELAQRHRPDVIVLDLEVAAVSPTTIAGFGRIAQECQTSLVVLGTARLRREFPAGSFVAKPYHYAPLVRKIERLLDEVEQPQFSSA